MSENKEIPPQYDLNAKWDACLDLGVRRFVYSSAVGAFAGLLFFREGFEECVAREVKEETGLDISEGTDMVLGDSVASSSEIGVRPVHGVWPCPFKGFHCCPDGMAGSKGFPRLIAHIKRLHLSSDDRKKVLRDVISTDFDLFNSVGEALKASGQWLCGDGVVELILSLLAQPSNETPSLDKPSPSSDNSATHTNVKQCLRKVADGHFTAAMKVLCSSGVAPFGNDALKALVAKHPTLPPLVMPDFLLSEPPLVVDVDCVFKCIASFPKGTSCGRDELRAQHILNAFCGEGSAITGGLIKVIFPVVNLCLAGTCHKTLAEYVASAPLTPLLKPDNGIRPIAVGMIWRSLVSKAAMRGVGKEMAKYLGDFNLGTSLLHEVQTRCPSISLWVDFLYGQPASLYVGNDHIWSTTRVQQGDL
ncbi:hypothetical protein E3N88_23268 [Mikania micrantha]|uniref:Uncharacterized protein n=1 Tax=Mikania micrantha TaxID=192012 RepID=A0A5N6NEN0_9ASTR|nr:hypothetical protein E3N88_23268 [Mikania micrantha]